MPCLALLTWVCGLCELTHLCTHGPSHADGSGQHGRDCHTPCLPPSPGQTARRTLSTILVKRLQPSQEASCSLVAMLWHTSCTRVWEPTSSIWAGAGVSQDLVWVAPQSLTLPHPPKKGWILLA